MFLSNSSFYVVISNKLKFTFLITLIHVLTLAKLPNQMRTSTLSYYQVRKIPDHKFPKSSSKVPNIFSFKFNTHDVNTKSQTQTKKSLIFRFTKKTFSSFKIVGKCQKVSKNHSDLWKNRELGKMGAKESRQFPLNYDEAIKRGKKSKLWFKLIILLVKKVKKS